MIIILYYDYILFNENQEEIKARKETERSMAQKEEKTIYVN